MRAPSVTIAMLIVLALGFGTAAIADTGGTPNTASGKTGAGKSGDRPTPTTGTVDDAGTQTTGDDATTSTPTVETTPATTPATDDLPPAAAPLLGKSAAVAPVSGAVNVKLPGRAGYVPLGNAASVPMGATIDASKGTVKLTSAHNASGTPQSAEFHDGIFTVTGQTKGSSPVTNLVLKGGDFSACDTAALRRSGKGAKTAKHPPVRQLWGSGHGRFKTSGRYSAATVHGTIWLTRDSCDGTLTIVKRGVVSVYDKVRRKKVSVKAGQTYFVPAPLPIAAATKLIGF